MAMLNPVVLLIAMLLFFFAVCCCKFSIELFGV